MISEDSKLSKEYFDEVNKRRKMKLLSQSNIPEDLLRYKWNDYKINNNEKTDLKGKEIKLNKEIIDSREKALNQCLAYSKNLPLMKNKKLPWMSILLIGESGSGKSVLGSLILRSIIDILMEDVFYISFPVLLSDLDVKESHYKINEYSEYKFLMIDEIDAGYFIDRKTQLALNTILTKRALYNNPTIITSKIPYESMPYAIGLPSYRLLGKKESYFHIHILNDPYITDESLLSPDTLYSKSKIRDLIKWLSEVENESKGKDTRGIRGHIISLLLRTASRKGSISNQEIKIMLDYAKGNIVSEEEYIEKKIKVRNSDFEKLESGENELIVNNLEDIYNSGVPDLD